LPEPRKPVRIVTGTIGVSPSFHSGRVGGAVAAVLLALVVVDDSTTDVDELVLKQRPCRRSGKDPVHLSLEQEPSMSSDASEANGCCIRNVDRRIDKDEFIVRIDLGRKIIKQERHRDQE
jgi:hypothetical protein